MDFNKFLEMNGQYAGAAIPYMIRRVQDCYEFLRLGENEKVHAEQKKTFLAHLAKDHEDWQVKQTDSAIRF
jgi:hypothetical protein